MKSTRLLTERTYYITLAAEKRRVNLFLQENRCSSTEPTLHCIFCASTIEAAGVVIFATFRVYRWSIVCVLLPTTVRCSANVTGWNHPATAEYSPGSDAVNGVADSVVEIIQLT